MSEEIIQGTDEWKMLRLGKVTASRVKEIVATTKTGYSTSRDKYMTQLLLERLTGTVAESYSDAAMQWGTEQEPFARAAYEAAKGVMVDQVAFVNHPTIEMAGASPDGLVNDDGLVELKCPMSHTHLETLKTKKIPSDYITQMQWQLAVTGRKWCDFVSFDSRMPNHLQLFIARVNRDEEYISFLELEVCKFLNQLEESVKFFNKENFDADTKKANVDASL